MRLNRLGVHHFVGLQQIPNARPAARTLRTAGFGRMWECFCRLLSHYVLLDLHQRMGLGLERFPTACGAAWGHSGSFPGYWTHAWSSATGSHQAVLMVNIDPSAVSDATRVGFYNTLYDAYCSAAK